MIKYGRCCALERDPRSLYYLKVLQHEVLQFDVSHKTNKEALVPAFKGALIECLADLMRQSIMNADDVAKFCGVTVLTVLHWNNEHPPVGFAYLKLLYLLREAGYEPATPQKAHEASIYVCKLIAFDVLTARDALQLLELETVNESSYIGRIVRGQVSPLAIKNGSLTLEVLKDMYQTELDQKIKEKLPDLPRGDHAAKPDIPRVQTESNSPAPSRVTSCPATPPKPTTFRVRDQVETGVRSAPTSGQKPDQLIVMTSSALLACLPYLKALQMCESPEVNAEVRELMGRENFFDLLDALKGMSSREAGKFFQPAMPVSR
jgi:hypothetical protein